MRPRPPRIPWVSWRTGAGLTIGRDSSCKIETVVSRDGLRFCSETPHQPIRCLALVDRQLSLTASAAGSFPPAIDVKAPSAHQLITIRCLVDPHRSQGGDNLALHRQPRMGFVMGRFE